MPYSVGCSYIKLDDTTKQGRMNDAVLAVDFQLFCHSLGYFVHPETVLTNGFWC